MDITTARNHYRTVQNMIKGERTYRDKYLAEPRRSEALNEADAALAALVELGKIIQAASEAGILAGVMEQASLFELPDRVNYR